MEDMSLKEKVDLLFEQMQEKPVKKKIKIPRRAKVSKGKMRKGWMGIIKIDENGNISGEKQRIVDSTFQLKMGDYHAVDGSEIGYWEGKYPVIIQPSWKNCPIQIKKDPQERNETYIQKYIKARMLGDVIKIKAKAGKIIPWIIGLVVVGFVAMQFMGK